ncbi:MAG: 50S ribosomal protein L25 [Planctomycetes bacterium]|nr:50S ribosomal protein L25 [Planctomycetota bacterium]
MLKTNALAVEKRTDTGKRACAKLRDQGKIPGILYSKGKENVNVAVSLKDFVTLLERGERMLTLDIEGQEETALIKDVQHGTYDFQILHADFESITENTIVHLNVEVELSGVAPGTKVGGVVEQELFQLRVECMSKDIPLRIEVDIMDLQIDGIIHVEDLPTIPGVKFMNPGNTPVVICHMPAGLEEPEAVEEGAAGEEGAPAEPEVIGKKSKDEESEEK